MTGGILPGVTVEATSPVMIEGTLTAFTDGAGRCTIINLRPGTYTGTFREPGGLEGRPAPALHNSTKLVAGYPWATPVGLMNRMGFGQHLD